MIWSGQICSHRQSEAGLLNLHVTQPFSRYEQHGKSTFPLGITASNETVL